ncbi:MAG TPA: ABC transporter substrate-binding protein [Dongiaceae bacterium]|nr:ABC transporter substrate-binding protein [Dongiaceae bacterium]
MAADEQRDAAARANATAEAKTRFLAAMAHELKNPLNAISGYAQFLQMLNQSNRPGDMARSLDSIETASKHLTALIDDTLLAAKLDAGKTPLELADLDLREVTTDLDKLVRPQIEAGGNRFAVHIAPEVGAIVGDRTKIQQILINLLSNAAKFTRNGTVHLDIERRDAGHVLLRVADTGAGMNAQQLKHLFEAFTEIGGPRSRELGGTGLGMFITRNLCALLGGEIAVTSAPGNGTRFEVVLPAMAQQAEIARPPRDKLLAIGVREGVPHSDPHLNTTEIDFYCAQHMFEGLTALDREGQIVPCLAVKWRRIDEVTWEFDLKPGVTFHDGSPFEAEDVLASFERLRWIARGGLNNNQILAVIRDLRAIDSHRLRITTVAPHLALLLDLVEVHIIQRRFVQATTLDFDSGRAAIGTGPFRQIERDPIEVRLAAFADYHGAPTAWAEVDFRQVKTRAENYAQLAKGEIDLVYALPLDWRFDYAPQKAIEGVSDMGAADAGIASHPGLMLTFLAPCFLPHLKGGCRDAQDRNLDQNPLVDRRVRAALSFGIDRDFICQELLGGFAQAAGDVVPASVFGADPALSADLYDPDRAHALLSEAGFADGLIIEAAYSDDVPPYQWRALRAVEIMLAGIGVTLRWNMLARDVLHDHANAERYGLKYQYWTCSTGDSFYNLQHLVATPDEASGYGATNFGRYSSLALDSLIRAADEADSDAARLRALRRAGALAITDRAILPLYFPNVTWAYRKGYRPLANAQAATLAKWVVPER